MNDNVISISQEAYDEYRSKPHEKPDWEAQGKKLWEKLNLDLRDAVNEETRKFKHPDLKDWQADSLEKIIFSCTAMQHQYTYGIGNEKQYLDTSSIMYCAYCYYKEYPIGFTKNIEKLFFKALKLIPKDKRIDDIVSKIWILF